MDLKEFFILSLLLCCAQFGWTRMPRNYLDETSASHVNVMDFEAVGDGETDDSQAFLKAWDKACRSLTPSTLIIPSHKSFLLSSTNFEGPCESDSINVQILGHILAPSEISSWESKHVETWILFDSIKGLTINGSGSGKIDGQGSSWWECKSEEKCSSAPTAVGVNGCDDFQINGLKFVNSQGMHVVLNKCNGVKISNVEISAPEDSPNTDGIHFQRCKNVEITNSVIGTGDDCISIGTATSNVNISKVFCGPGHGISVGSLGKHDSAAVEQIHVSNCTLRSTMYGARIKTWQGGSGFAKSITFEDIIIDSTDNPIVIDQYYCNGNHNCGNNTSAVEVSDVKFVNFQGTSSSKIAIKLACSETVACTDIHLRQVNLKTPESKEVKAYCLNVKGTSTDVNPDVPCLDN